LLWIQNIPLILFIFFVLSPWFKFQMFQPNSEISIFEKFPNIDLILISFDFYSKNWFKKFKPLFELIFLESTLESILNLAQNSCCRPSQNSVRAHMVPGQRGLFCLSGSLDPASFRHLLPPETAHAAATTTGHSAGRHCTEPPFSLLRHEEMEPSHHPPLPLP
jgi:hypothetical protein